MLSYRHAFHAGNFADVLKHSTLALVLDYFTQKQKGFNYIDSHSGAGMYQLSSEYAEKTGEYKAGIELLLKQASLPEEFEPYLDIIKSLNSPTENKSEGDVEHSSATSASLNLELYPGSPGIAKSFLRRQDSAHLYELHSTDNQLLNEYCQRWNKAKVYQSDGYKGVIAHLPPATRRAVVLIDPPYELKEDYHKAVQTIIDGYRKFATGCYILWYPVVKRAHVDDMEAMFLASNLTNVLQVEYCQAPDTEEYGMTGTGLFIVNPPWQLAQQLTSILTTMTAVLGDKNSATKLHQLIAE
ncbi:MAG: 23S rRNA (adenine(2030)-N(6))-methyltransferase RlmJ [Thalassotalea sp.]